MMQRSFGHAQDSICYLVARRRQQEAVDPSRVVDEDQLENPVARLHPRVGEKDSGVRISDRRDRVFGRNFLREDGVDDEAVRVEDVDLSVGGGDDEEGAVRRPHELTEGRQRVFVDPDLG